MKKKICNICEKEFPLTEEFFLKNKNCKGGFLHQCNECRKEAVRKRYHNDIVKNREKARENYRKYRARSKSTELKMRYGITLKEYYDIFSKQNHACAICLKRGSIKRYMAVDHDHKTGEVRGLLCSNCNTAIGLLKEDIDVLQRAIDYLKANKK